MSTLVTAPTGFRVVKDRKAEDIQISNVSLNTVPVGNIADFTPLRGSLMLNNVDLIMYYSDGTDWFPLCCGTEPDPE